MCFEQGSKLALLSEVSNLLTAESPFSFQGLLSGLNLLKFLVLWFFAIQRCNHTQVWGAPNCFSGGDKGSRLDLLNRVAKDSLLEASLGVSTSFPWRTSAICAGFSATDYVRRPAFHPRSSLGLDMQSDLRTFVPLVEALHLSFEVSVWFLAMFFSQWE